jgi:hypothetical protein
MTQRDGRETYFTAVSNHVAPALWFGMADDNLITRAEPRNQRGTHDHETEDTQSTGGKGSHAGIRFLAL